MTTSATASPSTPAGRATARTERIAAADEAFRSLIAVHRFTPDSRRCSAGCRYWPCDGLWKAAAACTAASGDR